MLFSLEGTAMATGRVGQAVKVKAGQVGHGIHLGIAPDIFHGIKLRGVRRQKMGMEVGALSHKVLGALCAVGKQPVPNQSDGACEVGAQDPQELDDEAGRNIGVGMEAKTQVYLIAGWRNAQGSNGRHLLMQTRALIEHRCMSTAAPRTPHQRSHQEAAFVEEDQPRFAPGGFFLMRGHPVLTQFWISASFRSTARRWGFCGLHPRECKRRPT